ncbi:hypothetical protein VT84_18530 [Gemmata sp. SH-PL17]|uniref:Uncharacterized protein n=1 Tax=Gemmata massiliana TaxID=1210884 RepID=A0A6P2D375_9BACT|nr:MULTISPECIES: hypothetical protein [Gemmata]AMV26401.1 hypothetical protein VT84_18530 [Gemmata sp. SH-PL17]VTR95543.1 unnamed protein product [Gemmata massiliana]
MSQTAKPQVPTPITASEPAPPYRRVYAWVFQAWLIMFLGVICCALLSYLLSYIPK